MFQRFFKVNITTVINFTNKCHYIVGPKKVDFLNLLEKQPYKNCVGISDNLVMHKNKILTNNLKHFHKIMKINIKIKTIFFKKLNHFSHIFPHIGFQNSKTV